VDSVLSTLGARAREPALWHVPGRVEVLGKHTDYAGGRSLLAALDRGFVIGMVPRDDATVTVRDAASGVRAAFALGPDLQPLSGRWAGYPMTVARRIARNFPGARRGADLAIASDLPSAAGMSSSSALVVATFLALAEANQLESTQAWQLHLNTPEALAGYLGSVENGQSFGPFAGDAGVGTEGGSQDHTAILCCRAGFLSRYAFCPVTLEGSIPWSDGLRLVIAVSGVKARKTGSERAAYNRASRATRRILGLWRAASGSTAEVLARAALEPGALEGIAQVLGETPDPEYADGYLARRYAQFVAESFEIIPAAAEALGRGDLQEFGRQVDRSQRGAEEGLGNQVAETIVLARTARSLGAWAASGFGAGFGGSVWALVDTNDAERFEREWLAAYAAACPAAARRAKLIMTRPAAGATRLS
jgi:galactokinase